MFPWLMVTIWRRCPSIFLLFLVYLIICFRVYFDLASAIILDENRSGEWGDHVTLQAAADSVRFSDFTFL